MGDLAELWEDVEEAVRDSLSNSEGRASAWYLEHAFKKADLGVFRQPDHPLIDPHSLRAALQAQMEVSTMFAKRLGLTAQDIADCTAQARAALTTDI